MRGKYTVKENHMFSKIFQRGKYAGNSVLTLHVLRNYNRSAPSRLGISVSAKKGGAVQRNRAKRVVRVAFGAAMPKLAPGWLIIAVPKECCYSRDTKSKDVVAAFAVAAKRLGVFV